MCWSLAASAIFGIVGLAFAGHLAFKKESKLIWMPLGYFALMEGLQAITYLYLGSCDFSGNQLLTFLSYMHIVFQPIFINAFILYFIPAKVRKKIIWPVFTLAAIITIILILKIYPFEWAGSCTPGTAMCGEELCSYMGNWHLAWSIPFNDVGIFSMLTFYLLGAYALPLIYGSWKATLVGLTWTGIAFLLSSNPHEWTAIWCLMSVWIMIFAVYTPMRKWLHVEKWYFWKYPGH
ncbi:hypothetical protein COU60_03020 [Candidatus Pacearchaeota archaeon CG10_big_fil_rev_8_21_14_0_10_34_76]|nr:MAG: hypothetical protein COU60_03020 [Candidatus Pacearchaeota archaeon CG10_big_fil_rev_8_21_14_0_10_34_76]